MVLCGGPGTRLRPITYYFQKSMVPVGLRQKPVLEYIVRLLRYHGVNEVCFLVNYKCEQIRNYFNDGSRFGVKISYLYDDPKLKGTGGSILNAYNKGVINLKNTALVYYGDILTNLNLREMLEYHMRNEACATVALAPSFRVGVGVAEVGKDGRILRFIEKPMLRKPVTIGILALNGEALEFIRRTYMEKKLDLMGDIIPHLIKSEKPVYGYISNIFWYDVGSVEAYEKLAPKTVETSMSFLFEEELP